MTKETVNVLLNLLKQVTISPMVENADANYQALANARSELLQLLEEKKEVGQAKVKKKI